MAPKKAKVTTPSAGVLKIPARKMDELRAATKIPPMEITMTAIVVRGIDLAIAELKQTYGKK